MKVVHVLKKIDMIDQDIKELRKLEKSVDKTKSFSTPIYMSIEKQINILLGERIKLLELKIANPPDAMVEQIEGKKPEEEAPIKVEEKKEVRVIKKKEIKKAAPKKKVKTVKTKTKKTQTKKQVDISNLNDDEIPMLTQDIIDKKIKALETNKSKKAVEAEKVNDDESDENVKLLDIALEKGTLNKKELEKDKGREKKVRFFRENFPVE